MLDVQMEYQVDKDLLPMLERLRLATAGKGLERPLKASAALMIHSINQNFENEGRPEKWAQNTPSTILRWIRWKTGGKRYSVAEARREAYGIGNIGVKGARVLRYAEKNASSSTFGKKVGRWTGDLRRTLSSTVNAEAGTAEIFPTQPYAIKFQEGDSAKNQPPRPFMMFQESDINGIHQFFQDAIDRAIETGTI